MAVVRHKEAIHSGHFMISDFEAEAEDEEDIAVPPPEEGSNIPTLMTAEEEEAEEAEAAEAIQTTLPLTVSENLGPLQQHLNLMGKDGKCETVIDLSLNKLFRSMTIAYRQRLTSPKWNRFRGLKLRWKDKIRLNNVIWRCWHIQFIKGSSQLLWPFANPLEIDNHNRTEGSTLLEGKYWKRKLKTVTKEYMKWRLFYKKRGEEEGAENDDDDGNTQFDLIMQTFQPSAGAGLSKDDAELDLNDDFLLDLFNTFNGDGPGPGGKSPGGGAVASFQFPNPRELQKSTTNADFIQPGLVQLQPNLDDFFMGLDSQQEWLLGKLPTIQEDAEEDNLHQQQQQQGSGAGTSRTTSSSAVRQQQHPPAASKGKTLPNIAPQQQQQQQQLQQQQQSTANFAMSSVSVQQQQQQQQLPTAPVAPLPQRQLSGDSSSGSNSYPLNLVAAAGTSGASAPGAVRSSTGAPPPNAVIAPLQTVEGANAFLSQQQQPPRPQATVMDLASAAVALQQQQQQQQQLQLQLSSNGNSLYPPPSYQAPLASEPRQKLQQSLYNNSQKRHSPKHRILVQHREYTEEAQQQQQQQLPTYETAKNLTVPFASSSQQQGQLDEGANRQLMQQSSPYEGKFTSSAINATTATAAARVATAAAAAPAPHPASSRSSSYFDRQRGVAPSFAGVKRAAAAADTARAAAGAAAGPFGDSNSQLVQLLKTAPSNKVPKVDSIGEVAMNLQAGAGGGGGMINSVGGALLLQQQQQLLQLQQQQQQQQHPNNLHLSPPTGPPSSSSSSLSPPASSNSSFLPVQVKVEPEERRPTIPLPLPHHPPVVLHNPTRPVPPVPQRDQLVAIRRRRSSDLATSPRPQGASSSSRKGSGGEKRKNGGGGSGGGGSKNGFDLLRSLIPSLNGSEQQQQRGSGGGNVKISKAALLHKGGDYLQQLKVERAHLARDIDSHRAKAEALNAALADLHKTMALGASGATGGRRGFTEDTYQQLESLFDDHVLRCTRQNWKYWYFSLLMRPLLASFQSSVDASSFDDLSRSVANWVEQRLSLSLLRPAAVRALTEVARRTPALAGETSTEQTQPPSMAETALAEAAKGSSGGGAVTKREEEEMME